MDNTHADATRTSKSIYLGANGLTSILWDDEITAREKIALLKLALRDPAAYTYFSVKTLHWALTGEVIASTQPVPVETWESAANLEAAGWIKDVDGEYTLVGVA